MRQQSIHEPSVRSFGEGLVAFLRGAGPGGVGSSSSPSSVCSLRPRGQSSERLLKCCLSGGVGSSSSPSSVCSLRPRGQSSERLLKCCLFLFLGLCCAATRGMPGVLLLVVWAILLNRVSRYTRRFGSGDWGSTNEPTRSVNLVSI